jgi:hypothetical protein
MEEIKNLFIKHFGFFPDIISTTEHAYISPPSRIISSLIKLSGYKNEKVLRFVITDKYSIHPESCVQRICLPHILNKNLFKIAGIVSKTELVQKFNDDIIQVEEILKDQPIFSQQEFKNYAELIGVYKNIIFNLEDTDPVIIYNNIIRVYSDLLGLPDLCEWLNKTNLFAIDSVNSRLFLKEAFSILHKINPVGVGLFGEYLEKNKRLKYEDNNHVRQIISWRNYLEEIKNNSMRCSIPFEIVLYVYSYCEGSHFGNDYGMVEDINKLKNSSDLFQITEHNKDYLFNIEIKNVQFQKVTFIKNEWGLSHNIYKNISTLSELFIFLGRHDLQTKFKKSLLNVV